MFETETVIAFGLCFAAIYSTLQYRTYRGRYTKQALANAVLREKYERLKNEFVENGAPALTRAADEISRLEAQVERLRGFASIAGRISCTPEELAGIMSRSGDIIENAGTVGKLVFLYDPDMPLLSGDALTSYLDSTGAQIAIVQGDEAEPLTALAKHKDGWVRMRQGCFHLLWVNGAFTGTTEAPITRPVNPGSRDRLGRVQRRLEV